MASTYTTRLRLVKPTTGELTNTWGDIFNQQFSDLIDVAIAGYASVSIADTDTTLTATNGSSDQARNMMLKFTGTLTAARSVIVPTSSKLYFVENATTGGFDITIKTASGTGVTIPANSKTIVGCDATNVVALSNLIPAGSTINSYTVGYLEIPQNAKSTNYTLVLSDSGKHIHHPLADTTARVWTIPANSSVAYPIGTALTFTNDAGAGEVIITINSPDVLVLAGTSSTGSRTLAEAGVATALKIASTRWIISGTNIS